MYAIVLGLKPKTIHIKNIESEKTSYLNAPDKNVKKGDVLEVNIQSTNFHKGMTFFKGEYEKLNDGESEFKNCLKCEDVPKKGKPLCLDCWHHLIDSTKNKNKKPKKKDYGSIRNADLTNDEITSIEKEIDYIINNIDIIREFIVDLSYANIKDVFDSIENRINTERKRMAFKSTLDNLESILPNYYLYPEMRGLFFEMAFHKMIKEMISENYGIQDIKTNYNKKFEKIETTDYESDGEIKFDLAGQNESAYCLYDCKAYSKGYNIKNHLEKMVSYINQKIDDPRESKKYKYFLVVSGEFKGNPEYHSRKLSEEEKKNFRFVLMTSKQFEKLYNQQAKNIWRRKCFYDEFRWEDILEPQNAKPIELISDKKIDSLIQEATDRAK